MLYLKIGGGALLILCGTLTGIYCSEGIGKRQRLYEEYIRFLVQVQSIVGYTAASVADILTGVSGFELIKPLLSGTAEQLKQGKDFALAWKQSVFAHIDRQEDREFFVRFGSSFGTSNCSGELNKLALYRESAERKYKELTEEYRTKRRLYRMVGMFSGAMAAVLML